MELVDGSPDSSGYAIVLRQSQLEVLSGLPPASAVLVYNCRQNNENFKTGPLRCTRNQFQVSTEIEITRQLSGLSISAEVPEGSFILADCMKAKPLIRLGDESFFVYKHQDRCDWFFLGSGKVADPDDWITDREFSFNNIFAETIPFVMFFQHVCGVRHSSYANLILTIPAC